VLPPRAQDAVARATETGASFEESGFKDALVHLGWSDARIWSTFLTYRAAAHMRRRWEQVKDPDIADVMAAFQFNAVLDSDTPPSHARLAGVIAPTDDAIWRHLSPPLDWECRCSLRLVSKFELKRLGADPRYERHGRYLLPKGMDLAGLSSAIEGVTRFGDTPPPWDRSG
jgi:SPP1 gp7 family putative phage head morphogenesis protein